MSYVMMIMMIIFFFEKLGDDILFIFDYELLYLNEIFNNDY